MGLLDFFKNNLFSKLQLTSEEEKRLCHHIDTENLVAIENLVSSKKVDLERPMSSGETPLEYSFRKTLEKLDAQNALRQEKNKSYADLIETFQRLQGAKENIGPYYKKNAVCLFSYGPFLEKLGIPKEEWPEMPLTPELLEKQQAAKDDLQINKNMSPVFEASFYLYALQSNAHGPISARTEQNFKLLKQPYLLSQKETDEELQTRQAIQDLGSYLKEGMASLNAKEFLDLINEKDVQNECPWMMDFKPDEENFIEIFDLEISKKGNGKPSSASRLNDTYIPMPEEVSGKPDESEDADEEDDAEMIMTIDLDNIGYYDWQSERLTEEKARRIQENKEQEERAREIERENSRQIFMAQIKNMQLKSERNKERSRDCGFDMER